MSSDVGTSSRTICRCVKCGVGAQRPRTWNKRHLSSERSRQIRARSSSSLFSPRQHNTRLVRMFSNRIIMLSIRSMCKVGLRIDSFKKKTHTHRGWRFPHWAVIQFSFARRGQWHCKPSVYARYFAYRLRLGGTPRSLNVRCNRHVERAALAATRGAARVPQSIRAL